MRPGRIHVAATATCRHVITLRRTCAGTHARKYRREHTARNGAPLVQRPYRSGIGERVRTTRPFRDIGCTRWRRNQKHQTVNSTRAPLIADTSTHAPWLAVAAGRRWALAFKDCRELLAGSFGLAAASTTAASTHPTHNPPPEYVRVSLESESSPSSATSVPTHSEVRSFAARKVCLWGDTMPSTVVFPAHTQQQCQPTQCSKGSALARRIPLNMDVTSAPMQRRNK